MSITLKTYQRDHNPRTTPHFTYWDELMACSRKTNNGCTNVNPNPCKTLKAFRNQRKTAIPPPSPGHLMFPSHPRKAQRVVLTTGSGALTSHQPSNSPVWVRR